MNNFFNTYISRMRYTWQHKKSFLNVEKLLKGKNTISGYLHDIDKLVMYFLCIPTKTAQNIHEKVSPHHMKNNKIKNLENAVIDWECARFTKPDKPLNARQTYNKYYRNVKGVDEVLNKFHL